MSHTLSATVFGVHPVRILQAGLVVAWLIIASPFTFALVPLRAFEPLRKVMWPIVRRGKLLRPHDSSHEKNPRIQSISVPQSYFAHFYYLGVAWTSSLLFLSLGIAQECSSMATTSALDTNETCLRDAWPLVFLLLLYELQVTRRLYECIFVSSFNPSARLALLTYLFGLAYYVAVPPTLFLQSFRAEESIRALENVVSRLLLGSSTPSSRFLPFLSQGVTQLGKLGWMAYIGAAVMVYGMMHQHSCHKILASLRSSDRRQKQDQEASHYGIPRGDWFEVSSSAHFLAEVVIYFGIVLYSGGENLATWFILLFVVSNLYLLAVPTHEWYLAKFDDYPTSRRPLFPWIPN